MADPSFNYSYIPTVDHRESNLYREEYYSSTDTKIYFDDDEQTEIGFIQYEIQEQLKPIYGYNSRTFDDVVIGNRIVTGTFTVPIKNKQKQAFSVNQSQEYSNIVITKTLESYNKQEENNLYKTDWFGSTKRDSNNGLYENEIDSEYINKLIALGYSIYSFGPSNAIKKFQSENNITASGQLNNITKNKIDNEFDKLNAETITLDNVMGYNDLNLTQSNKLLSGDVIVLDNNIKLQNETIYKVLYTDNHIYYIRGDYND